MAPVSRHFKWRARSIASIKVAQYHCAVVLDTVFVWVVQAHPMFCFNLPVQLRSPQRKIQSHRRVRAGSEPVVLVKRLRLFVLRIDQKGICANMVFGLETSVDSKADQHVAYTASMVFNAPREAPQAKARDRMARQLSPLGLTELFHTNVCRTQRVEAQNFARLGATNQYKNRTDALCALLRRVFVQKRIKRWFATPKVGAVMPLGVKKLFLKHA